MTIRMSAKMPNGILSHQRHKLNHFARHDGTKTTTNKQSLTKGNANNNNSNTFNNGAQHLQQQQQQQQQQKQHKDHQSNNPVLNVAEMLLHGVADHEILDIWLRSIACQEFAKNFVDAGYDMPTISRITPQDLTAIGITDPSKRLKILSEIKKLNLQDGLPTFKPAGLSHWLSLLRLDSHYQKILCDQQIDTIEKACQLTWEDFEELGITKLGHQKRFLLAIERMKEMEIQESKDKLKPMSEPIYDTNPSQILLVASAENHSMNGPIINKQSSTSELSSTGSGSMHSLYSTNSIQYQHNYGPLPNAQIHIDQQQQNNLSTQPLNQNTQPIYGHLHPQLMQPPQQANGSTNHLPQQVQQTRPHVPQSHYQSVQPPQFINPIYDSNNTTNRNTMVPLNRQSLGQLPFALVNLPKHQQQLLQQSSIYATLSRQPQRIKQPPPPVPVRTNSLKTNSLFDEDIGSQTESPTNSPQTTNLHRSGTRVSNRLQYNSHTLLTKNKSFSGNAYMDAARARFLMRNSQQPPQIFNTTTIQPPAVFGINFNSSDRDMVGNIVQLKNVGPAQGIGNFSPNISSSEPVHPLQIARQSILPNLSTNHANTSNQNRNDAPITNTTIFNQPNPTQIASNNHNTTGNVKKDQPRQKDNFDVYSDTNSTKSLILPTTTDANNLTTNIDRQTSLSQDSSSSQTLYNSASSGSTDQNLNGISLPQPNNLTSRSNVSNSTLNDVNLILDQNQRLSQCDFLNSNNMESDVSDRCNATTGKDDDFPPPPSPLILTDSDEHDLHSISSENNFNDLSQRLMSFRVGI